MVARLLSQHMVYPEITQKLPSSVESTQQNNYTDPGSFQCIVFAWLLQLNVYLQHVLYCVDFFAYSGK